MAQYTKKMAKEILDQWKDKTAYFDKSFYGKAKVIEEDNGEKVLQSYNTRVCRITSGGKFVRMWGGSSPTTIRHINSFLQLYDIPGGGKAWWTAQEVKEATKKPGPDMTPEESYRAMMGRRMGKAV